MFYSTKQLSSKFTPFQSISFRITPIASIISLLIFTGCSSEQSTDVDNLDNNNVLVTTPQETTTVLDGSIVDSQALINLGDLIYNDTNLSNPVGQSCATCHALTSGFDDADSSNPTSIGADGISFGTRNSPTASYAAHIPAPENVGPGGGQLVGGLFMDGRAVSLEDQARGPFLNLIEMGNETEQDVINKIIQSSYADDFESLFGAGILQDATASYNYVVDAIAAFERTDIFSPFSSKFDRVQAGTDTFTNAEQRGQNLFRGKGDCERCHQDDADVVVFSDFEYENIGVPSNSFLPAVMADATFIDLGLGAETLDNQNNGQFRTPTLRNIAITAPYMHNGVFNTLEEVVDFYNTRDTTFADAPEVNENVDQGGRIGELNLTANEISDLIAFMNSLTDE
ncbi:MAG: hypothetical protein COA86_12440 [Kangiella sp.]|nr:MAG: hypothetical protein COA86_12440 [Kangiella sp.]